MKTLLLLTVCALLLAACSQTPQASIDPPDPEQYASPTTVSLTADPPTAVPQVHPTDDPVMAGIRDSLSSGPHAEQFSCEDCHGSSALPGAQLSWSDPVSGQTESISTPNELCSKCHPDQAPGKGESSQVSSPHAELGCVGCHDPHGTQASCTRSGCHSDITNIFSAQIAPPVGHTGTGDPSAYMCGGTACHELAKEVAKQPIFHQPTHRQVPCYVCHDGSGLEVVREPVQGWVTISAAEAGETEAQLVISHDISREVACQKCHSIGNPWGLMEILPGG